MMKTETALLRAFFLWVLRGGFDRLIWLDGFLGLGHFDCETERGMESSHCTGVGWLLTSVGTEWERVWKHFLIQISII